MASQSGEHHELNFTGESAEEAEDFIQAVNKRAYAARKQKDNAWIAEFAYPFFSRKALRWYETLDDETQNDWKLLKRAILAEFAARSPAPAIVPSAAPALVSSPSIPVPAAPPPSAVTVKIGRIRVDSEDRTRGGYLWINDSHSMGIITADSSKADTLEVDTLGRTLRFQGGGVSLLIKGYSRNSYLSPRTDSYACVMKSSENSGTRWDHTWSIAGDGTITAMLLRTDGSEYDANFLATSSVLGDVIHVPADEETFLRRCGNNWTRVTMHLEPLS